MGKLRKSEKKKDKLHKLLKKLDKINEKVNKIQKMEVEESSSTDKEDSDKEVQNSDEQEIQGSADLVLGKEEPSKNESVKVGPDVSAEGDSEREVDEDWLEILGTDPTQSQALEMVVKPELIKRWLFYSKNGLKKEEYESLIEKYSVLKELEAPKLNTQIQSTMKEFAIARDNHMSEIQKLSGSALSIIGFLITNMYSNKEEGVDLASILSHLCDVAKFLSLIIHKQSVSRKAFIEPGLSKETKAVLKDTEIDEYLYGKGLTEKIKEAKAINKLGENLKIAKPAVPAPKPSLNNRAPLVRRPLTQMGNTFTQGRPRQKLFFKNKQQYINYRAQMPQRPKGPPNQEKKF